jgi:protein-S-isoprenylcysteine O-methyltransferase Ste14
VPWAVALAEIVATAAKALPSDISGSILSALSINGTPPDLRLTPLFLVGMALICVGSLIRVSCYRTLKKFFTFEASIMKDHKLVTSGLYSIIRHPSYAGLLLVEVGLLCWFASRGSLLRESGLLDTMTGILFFGGFGAWMLAILVALMRRATVEDAALREAFRGEWEEWAKRVPYAFLPGVC